MVGAAVAHRAARRDAIALEHGARAIGSADLELLEITGRQRDRRTDDVIGFGTERVLAREVTDGLLDQRQEAGVDR